MRGTAVAGASIAGTTVLHAIERGTLPVPGELFGIILVVLVIGGLAFCIFVLPIWAFVRTARIGRLRERIDHLDAEMRQLRTAGPTPVMPVGPPEGARVPAESYTVELDELNARVARLEEALRRAPAAAPLERPTPGPRRSLQAREPEPTPVLTSPQLLTPLRLYFGNPKANPPHYDFAANLPERVAPPPARATLAVIDRIRSATRSPNLGVNAGRGWCMWCYPRRAWSCWPSSALWRGKRSSDTMRLK
jgi:hypothetical protein